MNNEQQNDAADVNVTGDPGDVGTSQAISDREQQLNEREAALNKREFTASIVEKLTTKKFLVKLAAVLAEGCTKENIDATLDATITPRVCGNNSSTYSPSLFSLGSPPPVREQLY